MSREDLVALVRAQAERIAELEEANKELAGRLARLEHLLSRNSGNSSMPPSRDDDPGRSAAKLKRSGGGGSKRSRGKQPGAPGSNLAWREVPDERVDRFPQGRCGCGAELAQGRALGIVDRYQQHEIPSVAVEVTQYDQPAVACGCGQVHTAARPDGARGGPVGYGPSLQALAVYLLVACTQRYTHYLLGGRDLETSKKMAIAELADGAVIVHDRYQNYDADPFKHLLHQLCTAHLVRDLEAAVELYPEEHWPTQIRDALRGLIHEANTARAAGADRINPEVKDELARRFRHGVLVGLKTTNEHGNRPGERKTRLLLEELRDRPDDVLRFTTDLRVPPTSNQAERDLRPSKIQQNISGRLTSVEHGSICDQGGVLPVGVIFGETSSTGVPAPYPAPSGSGGMPVSITFPRCPLLRSPQYDQPCRGSQGQVLYLK